MYGSWEMDKLGPRLFPVYRFRNEPGVHQVRRTVSPVQTIFHQDDVKGKALLFQAVRSKGSSESIDPAATRART
jgi:hypothetical protein